MRVAGRGPTTKQLDFGDDPNDDRDPEIFKGYVTDCIVSFIRRVAALDRSMS